MNIFNELQQRGLIRDFVDGIENHLNSERTIYCGFDPTADSLHVGSLLPLITMRRFQEKQHQVLGLVGGATALIGDPSFKSNERDMQDENIIQDRIENISNQIKHISKSTIVNNKTWMDKINILTFLRDVGKHFSVNAMINKESVKQRIDRNDSGISFAEFSYSLIQANDFKVLNSEFNCSVQIGGSDQWGNMVSGLDLIKKTTPNKPFCLTMPLVTKSDGSKFGKTESGTVWLDKNKTSPFEFFQFWLNVADDDIENFMLWFSLKTIEEIKTILNNDEKRKLDGLKPLAQNLLATEMTELVHGKQERENAEILSNALFSNGWDMDIEVLELLSKNGFTHKVKMDDLNTMDWGTLLFNTQLASSKTEGRRFIKSGAIKVFSKPEHLKDVPFVAINDIALKLSDDNFQGRFSLIKRGKKNAVFLEIIE